ncbi:hypothetical protein, partial [Anaerotignum lactatifermentans]|uniref:hypothetical protein n=1 Tax=Anaerotignum lactatifermentans TaxID=160404 RepID=UPI003080C25C
SAALRYPAELSVQRHKEHIAAIIGLFVKNKIPKKKNITIEQKIERGDNNTQIGIQNNYNKEGK